MPAIIESDCPRRFSALLYRGSGAATVQAHYVVELGGKSADSQRDIGSTRQRLASSTVATPAILVSRSIGGEIIIIFIEV